MLENPGATADIAKNKNLDDTAMVMEDDTAGGLDEFPGHRICRRAMGTAGPGRAITDYFENMQGVEMVYGFDGKQPVIGKDTYVSETATLIGDVRIGNNCYIGHGAILRGDYGTIEIGNESSVEEGVIVHAPPGEFCSIGNNVVIGHGAIIHAKSVGDHVGIGMGAILSIWSEAARGSIIAEGAVVKRFRKIPEGIIAAGNPAKKMRDVSKKEKDLWEWINRTYIDLAKKYCDIGMEKINIAECCKR